MQLPVRPQGLNNAVALDFDYRQQMIYWTDVTTQGSMIRRMYINGSDVQVSVIADGGREENLKKLSSSPRDTNTEGFTPLARFVRSFIGHHSATQMVWQWTGWEETCTGVIRDGTL